MMYIKLCASNFPLFDLEIKMYVLNVDKFNSAT